MEQYKILFIDDDISMLNTGEDILLEAGYGVSLAKSGEQGLKFLGKGMKYDLILLDVDMPDMDGYETFEKIKTIEGCEGIPVIFLTGMDAPDYEIKGLELGAADYITKPFVKVVLLARIKREIEKHKIKKISDEGFSIEGLEAASKVLTEGELAIAKEIALGYSNQEVSNHLNYSVGYVKKKVSEVLDKLSLKNRVEIRRLLRK